MVSRPSADSRGDARVLRHVCRIIGTMTRPFASPLVRVAVAVLIVAVMLCLVFPMSGDGMAGMHFALFCCFVLAVALGVFILRRPQTTLLLGNTLGRVSPLARGPTETAHAPDIFALGSLLI